MIGRNTRSSLRPSPPYGRATALRPGHDAVVLGGKKAERPLDNYFSSGFAL
jgi:hypothetical protein